MYKNDIKYVQTAKMLKFFKLFYKSREAENVLFIGVQAQNESEDIVKKICAHFKSKLDGDNIQIVLTDIKNGQQVFGLLPDQIDFMDAKVTVRYLDFSQVFESRSKTIYRMSDLDDE